MSLWTGWWQWASPLRSACARQRTFLWMMVVLLAFCVRDDLLGVTSMVRCLGLSASCYDRLLDFFHSPAMDVKMLTQAWVAIVLSGHPGLVRCHGRILLVGDGLNAPKNGLKMPAVKRLHQSSELNTKPTWIMGHSCQAIGVLVQCLDSVVSVPLAARIHEGVVFYNADKRTLLDKMVHLLLSLLIETPYYFVVDAYFASKKIIKPLRRQDNHLISRVRSNAVAYLAPPPQPKPKRGRPRMYGDKIPLRSLMDDPDAMQILDSPVYDDRGVQLRVRCADLLWRPVGILVRFVAVIHPTRGRCILMSTDLDLTPLEIIKIYGYRFKIEVSFKGSLRVVGAFLYHFWMCSMTPIHRGSGNQYLHMKATSYRDAVRRKLEAYHRFIQLALIAQGIMQCLATTVPNLVWTHFGSWLRTARPGICPSEFVVSTALRHSLFHFLSDCSPAPAIAKFILLRMDPSKAHYKADAA